MSLNDLGKRLQAWESLILKEAIDESTEFIGVTHVPECSRWYASPLVRMTKPRICILIYLVWACVALCSFVNAHGGLAGDFDRQLVNTNDPHSKNAYAASLAFNRWRIHFATEPIAYKIFVAAHTPAYIAGRLIFKILQIVPEFQDPFPLGLSFPSYSILLMLLLGVVQWYLIGLLADSLWARF